MGLTPTERRVRLGMTIVTQAAVLAFLAAELAKLVWEAGTGGCCCCQLQLRGEACCRCQLLSQRGEGGAGQVAGSGPCFEACRALLGLASAQPAPTEPCASCTLPPCSLSLCRGRRVSPEERDALQEALLEGVGPGAADLEAGKDGAPARAHSWVQLLGIALSYMWPDSWQLQVGCAVTRGGGVGGVGGGGVSGHGGRRWEGRQAKEADATWPAAWGGRGLCMTAAEGGMAQRCSCPPRRPTREGAGTDHRPAQASACPQLAARPPRPALVQLRASVCVFLVVVVRLLNLAVPILYKKVCGARAGAGRGMQRQPGGPPCSACLACRLRRKLRALPRVHQPCGRVESSQSSGRAPTGPVNNSRRPPFALTGGGRDGLCLRAHSPRPDLPIHKGAGRAALLFAQCALGGEKREMEELLEAQTRGGPGAAAVGLSAAGYVDLWQGSLCRDARLAKHAEPALQPLQLVAQACKPASLQADGPLVSAPPAGLHPLGPGIHAGLLLPGRRGRRRGAPAALVCLLAL